jgi:anti-anti-sigma factor
MFTNLNFKIQVIPERDIAILVISGSLDFDSRSVFATNIEKLLKRPEKKLVIDMKKVTQLFSVYYGTVIDVDHKAKKLNKNLTLIVNEKLEKMMKVAKIDETINIVLAKNN